MTAINFYTPREQFSKRQAEKKKVTALSSETEEYPLKCYTVPC